MGEMSHLKSSCGVQTMDGESNENMYKRSGKSREGMKCVVLEEVMYNTLRRFGHIINILM